MEKVGNGGSAVMADAVCPNPKVEVVGCDGYVLSDYSDGGGFGGGCECEVVWWWRPMVVSSGKSD